MTWREKLQPYQNRIIGVIVALIVGILLISIGFSRTLGLALIACIGYLVGCQKDGVFDQMLQRAWAGITGIFSRR